MAIPNPSLGQLWRGIPPRFDLPAQYRILRTVAVSSAAWTEYEINVATMAGAEDGIAQHGTAGWERAILRCVSVLNSSTTDGEDVKISLNVTAGSPAPADAYNTCIVSGPSIELRFVADNPRTQKFWLRASTGTPNVQLELWYDVPPAA